jgi:aminopeptidase-like protein
MNGSELHAFATRLYPICRSITGQGVRQSLALIGEHIPLRLHEVPSGSAVYDWEVPLEWNIDDACVLSADGQRVVDFQAHNLHLVSYSEPTSETLSLQELSQRLHSLPDHPDWIPYRTSYYRREWGFCLSEHARRALQPGQYRVEIKSSLAPGALTYGEWLVPGCSREEVLFFAHVCHPSLANDNTSGMAVATALAKWIAGCSRRYSYRFVFAPGTIGSLCWLRANESALGRIRGGLVLALLGDSASLTYKMSRDGSTMSDEVASHAALETDPAGRVIAFSPYGYDERQFCSPGFNLPIGRLTRAVNGGYPQYHSSADDLSLIRPQFLEESLDACKLFVRIMEENVHYENLSPYGEPRLGARGLYGAMGGLGPAQHQEALLWVLNQSDGTKSLLHIARRSELKFDVIRQAATALENVGLIGKASLDSSKPPGGHLHSQRYADT